MKRLSEIEPPYQLQWLQPQMMKSHYELRAGGGDLVGALRVRSSFGTFAEAEAVDAKWSFKRVGFFRQVATIRAADSEADLAAFRNNTWNEGGSLDLPGGRRFLATTNTWQTRFEWSLDGGDLLFRFKSSGLFRQTAEIEIMPAGLAAPESPLLLLFSWYLAVMMARDSAALAASISSS